MRIHASDECVCGYMHPYVRQGVSMCVCMCVCTCIPTSDKASPCKSRPFYAHAHARRLNTHTRISIQTRASLYKCTRLYTNIPDVSVQIRASPYQDSRRLSTNTRVFIQAYPTPLYEYVRLCTIIADVSKQNACMHVSIQDTYKACLYTRHIQI